MQSPVYGWVVFEMRMLQKYKVRAMVYHAGPNISCVFSMTNWTALFFECMSLISRSRL